MVPLEEEHLTFLEEVWERLLMLGGSAKIIVLTKAVLMEEGTNQVGFYDDNEVLIKFMNLTSLS